MANVQSDSLPFRYVSNDLGIECVLEVKVVRGDCRGNDLGVSGSCTGVPVGTAYHNQFRRERNLALLCQPWVEEVLAEHEHTDGDHRYYEVGKVRITYLMKEFIENLNQRDESIGR